ncbi:MAG TPA: zinc-binding dehydrogenase [Polyangiales bacterium]|nr:zinc-binding dehydrogenase [Polyangiales bacterium]
MKAIVISEYGGPEVLRIEERPTPEPEADTLIVRVRAFGVNHAEAYFRRGIWGDVASVTGIECAGEVSEPGTSGLVRGQSVFALMGGMGRSIDGTYAQYVRVPNHHVVPIHSSLDWTRLAALPESYATAWTLLRHNLELRSGETLVVRGGTSALGQAAINIARELGASVYATTRSSDKRQILEALGAQPLLEEPTLASEVRRRSPRGVDAVLDIVGSTTVADSLQMPRYRGRVALAGFLGGAAPLTLDPLGQMPRGVQLSFFASAFMFGTPDLPLSQIPFADFVARTEQNLYRAAPAHVFEFEDIVSAHQLLESGAARGKIVVRVS